MLADSGTWSVGKGDRLTSGKSNFANPMAQPPTETHGFPEHISELPSGNAAALAPNSSPLIASPWHMLLVLCVQAYLSYRGSSRATHMLASPDRIRLYERTILFEWLVLGLVVIGVWLHGSSLDSVFGERWRSVRHFARDLGIGILFLFAAIVVGSVLSHGIEGSAARVILPLTRAEMLIWVALSVTAGICEEALYRGYLQKQFIAITRSVPAGILLSAVLFGMAHAYQGLGQALQIAVLGAMGGVLAYWCKSVRPGMIAHALQDVLGGLMRHS